MKTETFEQKRMLEISKELDRERQRNKKLVEETHELALQIKDLNAQIEKLNQEMEQQKNARMKLGDEMRELINSNKITILQKQTLAQKFEKVEVENVRQRQKIDELKEEMIKFENGFKDVLYVKQKELNEKERENFTLREQNIEVEKLYLKQKEEQQRREEKHFKSMAKLKSEIDRYSKDLESLKNYFNKILESEKQRSLKEFQNVFKEINRIEELIQKEKKLKGEIRELKERLEEVVIENSQKIIELYRYKNYL